MKEDLQNQSTETAQNESSSDKPATERTWASEVKPNHDKQLQDKVSELNDKLLRTLAEIDNVRKRSKEEIERANKYAISSFVSDLVVIAENLFLATENLPQDQAAIKNFIDAVLMTKKELMKVLEKNQVSRIYPIDQKFDHNLHEAIAEIESKAEAGTVLQVVQAGYTIADRLVRPALVTVAKN